MNRSELVEAVSRETGLPMSKAEEVVRTVFDTMTKAIANGERVEIRGLGAFSVKHYDGYMGRNPKTGEAIKVKPKKLSYFKCGKELKETVDIQAETEGGKE